MKLKTVLLILLCAICLSGGCAKAQPAVQSSAAPKSEPSSQEQAPAVSDTFYPSYPSVNGGGYVWLDGGRLLAAMDHSKIRYIDLNNQLVNTVTIPDDKLIGDFQFILYDNRIFAAGGFDGENYPGSLSACKVGGKWVLANGSVWDGRGNLLREFVKYRVDEDGTKGALSDGGRIEKWEDTNVVIPTWINEDLVALNGGSRLFFYRLSTNTLTLVDDMSAWILPYGKMGGYFGVSHVIPAEDGCYYFAYKNEEKWNTEGTVWYADETGSKVLFDGQEFENCFGENGILVMLNYMEGSEAHSTENTHVWYALGEERTLHDMGLQNGWRIERLNDTRILFRCEANQNDSGNHFYIVETLDGSKSFFEPPVEGCTGVSFLTTRKADDSLQYIYAATTGTEERLYLYDSKNKSNTILKATPSRHFGESINALNTHFAELYPDSMNFVSVRVSAIA